MLFRFDHPALLWLLLLAAPVTWLGLRSLAALEPVRRWTAIGLRLAVLALLVLMLAGLQTVRWQSDLAVVAVLDESESVRRLARPPAALPGSQTAQATGEELSIEQWIRRWVRLAAQEKRPDDRLGLITFDGRVTVHALPAPALDLDSGTINRPAEGSAIGDAIRQAIAAFPPDASRRLFLASDGNENLSAGRAGEAAASAAGGSDLLAAAFEAKAAGIPIDVLPIEYHVEHEVMVQGLYAPTEAREGQTVALRVVLRATAPTEGLLYLKHDGMPVDLNGKAEGLAARIAAGQWTVDADADSASGRYVCVRLVELPLSYSGAHRFEALFEPAAKSADTMAANNQAQAFTLAHGQGRILFVDNLGRGPGEVLPKTLINHGIQLDLIAPGDLPGNLAGLQRYDAVVLQNVPAELVMPAQQKMLARYVSDMGGGLIMIGGPDSFGAGGWTHTPVDRILPVDCQIPSQTILPSGALVLVIDRSGSMGAPLGNTTHVPKQEVANEAAVQAIATLYPQDMVGVVVFDDSPKWVVPLGLNASPAAAAATVRKVVPGGGTNIYPALVEAYEALAPVKAQDAAVKHIILLTDGQSQDGKYYEIVQKMQQAGITLSTVGVGSDVNAQLLNQLAQMGSGTYYPVQDAGRLPQIFIKEARSIRKNLIKEVPFTPQLVATGSPILAGVRAAPELKGLVLTAAKQDPRVFMPMVGGEGEPLFAHWQVGLGRTAAFTSDASNRWASAWLAWGGYADFWLRTVRAIARPSDSRQFDLLSTIRNDTLHLRLDAASDGAVRRASESGSSFMNFLQVAGSVLKPDGSVETVTLRQTGPGVYEADLPATAQGNYIASLFIEDSKGERHAVYGGASRAAGMELRSFTSNRAILEQVAQITGGRVLDPLQPKPGTIFNRQMIVPARSIRPLWRPLMIVLLVFFLLDVASRRIAWDFAAIWASVRSWLGSVLGTLGPRSAEADATLAALKARAAVVDQQLEAAGALPAAPPAASAQRKFEAPADAQAAEDFASAVGGAKASEEAAALAAAAKRLQNAEQETTSRLLDAKRRTRERLGDDAGEKQT